jgi:hypothetical protein
MFTAFHRGFLAALLVALAMAAAPGISHATHSWGGYHWARSSNSFTLKLGDNVSSAWDSYLAAIASSSDKNDWSESAVLDVTIVLGGTTQNVRKCNPTSGRVEVCSTTFGNNGWLGVAQIWISGLHITQGTVKLNDTYFNTAKYNTPAWRHLVMCQEVGHTFGLDHQDESFSNLNLGTCMDYTNDPDGTIYGQLANEYPNQHDYDELALIYSHLDSATTVKQTVNNKAVAAKEEPELVGTGQWGKLVRSTKHGRTEVYELDLGGRQKVVTFVIWADPEE